MKMIELFENQLEKNFDEMVELIKRDCQPFLKETGDALIFRGMRNSYTNMKMTVRQDRRPKNMAPNVHEIIDEWFEKNFKLKARSTAVFASGDFADARGYGPVYAIFPIGDFKFVWSHSVSDLFVELRYDETMSKEELLPIVLPFLHDADYQNDNLPEAIESGHEVMIHCHQYYAVRVSDTKEAALWRSSLY